MNRHCADLWQDPLMKSCAVTRPAAQRGRHVLLVLLTCLLAAVCIGGLCDGVRAEPFKVRGIKGLWWQGIEKYELALPWLAEHDLNFLMLCYSSFAASGKDWRSGYTGAEKEQIRRLAAKGRDLGVDVCLSFNPGIWSNPPLVYSSEQDCKLALDKVRTMHALGIRWFGLCLDDIRRELQSADKERFGTLDAAQVYFVNRLWNGMKTLKPRPRLIFCPSAYTTADAKAHQSYIQTIGKGIDREVMMFWTGPTVCSSSITAQDARLIAKWIRRKPFIWDNYPVNDMFPWRPLLSPLKNRSADLGDEVAGYLANPMKQWYASTIPLATTAMYLNDPETYDRSAAMETVIRSYPAQHQRAVRLLVRLYGGSFWGEQGFPPKPQFSDAAEARKLLPMYRALRKELSGRAGLANLWQDVQPTVDEEIALLEQATIDRRIRSPLKATGLDFEAGAASVYGRLKKGRLVNYIYAKPTGKHEMRTEFYLRGKPQKGATLRVVGLNDDLGVNGRIQIVLNEYAVHDGPADFSSADFEAREFDVPASALKPDANTLFIRCVEEKGTLGWPPWFIVAEAELIPKGD